MRWLQNHPKTLESMYGSTKWLIKKMGPMFEKIGNEKVDRWFRKPEEWSKQAMFDCQMCGQCVLHSTGMTCPMTCPKNLRNGPCGGVRQNGHCEVKPDMKCIWVEAFERSTQMGTWGADMMMIQPPVNRQLEGSSAWVNMVTGADQDVPTGWIGLNTITVLPKGIDYPTAK